MICLLLIFFNELSEGIFGKTFLNDPEKVSVCAIWELVIDIVVMCYFA